ncbi:MAG: efflux RND transporter periplasmic adaptor subunit, partial [Muribaculaceae bacterium]|nr:efflux RND transporter periplasmic adaptor subunit [Muribaculaceae bacterium]
MVCDVAINDTHSQKALTLPIDAVLLDADNQNFVWKAEDGKARKQLVKVGGFTSGTQLIVSEGLEQGDSVIVRGQQKVSSGTPVVNIDSEK